MLTITKFMYLLTHQSSFNEHENLDDINVYQINIVLSARKLAEASFNEHENLDDINVY